MHSNQLPASALAANLPATGAVTATPVDHLQNGTSKLSIGPDSAHVIKNNQAPPHDPVQYLSKSFKHPLTLLSVMFDTGSLLTGSRALEFFVSNSTEPSSDWDFIVSGYKESVADMINVLSICGVTWDLEADRIADDLSRNGKSRVKCHVLRTLSSWLLHCPNLFSPQLKQVLKAFKPLRVGSSYDECTITLQEFGEVRLEPEMTIEMDSVDREAEYKDATGDAFSIVRGTINGVSGPETVQLIVACYYENPKSPMGMILDFYSTHVQCFIGGWCAAHLYYDQAKDKKAQLWQRERDAKIERGIEKYTRRGYKFEDAPSAKPAMRHLRDGQTLFLDYGAKVYKPVLSPQGDILDGELSRRLTRVDNIWWNEFTGKIEWLHGLQRHVSRDTLEEPRSLTEAIVRSPTTPFFSTSLHKTADGEEWDTPEVVKSGSLYPGLPKRAMFPWFV